MPGCELECDVVPTWSSRAAKFLAAASFHSFKCFTFRRLTCDIGSTSVMLPPLIYLQHVCLHLSKQHQYLWMYQSQLAACRASLAPPERLGFSVTTVEEVLTSTIV